MIVSVNVAPRAGAWIETDVADTLAQRQTGRPPRGGVDRNDNVILRNAFKASRPPRGGVDRNVQYQSPMFPLRVAPRAGAWIETSSFTR